MMKTAAAHLHRFLGFLVTCLALLTGCDKHVILQGTSQKENGILVTHGASTDHNSSYVSAATDINVGLRSNGGEVVGFTTYRPVTVVPTDWSSNVTLTFPNQLSVPITFWIVRGDFNTQRTVALNALTTALQIFWDERMGIILSPIDVQDATGNRAAANYATFTCSQQAQLQREIGSAAGRLNVYMLGSVDRGGSNFATTNGNACAIGGNFVALGSAINSDLLAHEIGHNFGLTHTDDLTADFDQTNVMWSSSSTRQFLTEGQTMRAHLTPGSAMNALNLRPGLVTRNCPRDTNDRNCPAIRKRIWADGTFGAN
jgi:hypothetical protein